MVLRLSLFLFFFNETATTEIYTYCHTRSLPGALPFCGEAEEIALHALVHQQVGDVALAQFQVEARVVELVLALAVVAAVAGDVAGGARHELHQAACAVGAERARIAAGFLAHPRVGPPAVDAEAALPPPEPEPGDRGGATRPGPAPAAH